MWGEAAHFGEMAGWPHNGKSGSTIRTGGREDSVHHARQIVFADERGTALYSH